MNRAPASWTAAVLCRFSFALLFALLLASAPAARASAMPPDSMTYQGFLVDGNGNALATNLPANYPVIFRIYTAATGGTRLWSEQQIVTVDKGSFSVVLGEGTPVGGETKPALSSVFTGTTASDRYMSISVTIGGSTPEILPRLRLMPSPYAFLATSAANLVQPNGSTVLNYVNNRLEVTGNLFTSGTLQGNGSGLTGLTSDQIPASLAGNRIFTGNVGIGTGSPNAPLSFGSGLANTKLALWDGGPGSAFGFGIQPSQFRFHVNTSADRFSFLNGQAGTELMTIQGSGHVGIGTPPSAKLDVLGSTGSRLRVFEFGGGSGSQLVGGWAANSPLGPQVRYERVGAGGFWDVGMTGANYIIEESDIPRLVIRTGGNVGLGTSAPERPFHVSSVDNVVGRFDSSSTIGTWLALGNSSAGGRFWQFISTGSANGGGAGKLLIGSGPVDGSSGSKITVEDNGNIGFGTVTPEDRLHLRGGALRIDDGGGEYIRMLRSPNGLILSGNGMGNPAFPNGAGQIQWDGDNNWDNFSDRRLKQDITEAEPVLDRLMNLPVRRYRWKAAGEEGAKKFGVIAQEVEPLFPESVGLMTKQDTGEEYLTVKYGTFGLLAVKALQELKAEKDAERAAFKQEIAALKKEVESLKGRLAQTAQVDALQAELDDLKRIVQQLAAARKESKTGATVAAR